MDCVTNFSMLLNYWLPVAERIQYKLCLLVHKSLLGISVGLAGLLGGRMANAEGGSVTSGVGYGEGCHLSSRLRGLGERREFWRILKATERSFLYPYDKIWGEQFALASPRSKFWGDLSPPVPPVIYANASGTHVGIYVRPSDVACQYSRSIYTACFIVWQPRRAADTLTNWQQSMEQATDGAATAAINGLVSS